MHNKSKKTNSNPTTGMFFFERRWYLPEKRDGGLGVNNCTFFKLVIGVSPYSTVPVRFDADRPTTATIDSFYVSQLGSNSEIFTLSPPRSMLRQAAIPTRLASAPACRSARKPKGSGAFCCRKIKSCSEASAPP